MSTKGPGVSARARYWDCSPREGRTAVARISTPMPPSQWEKHRQNWTPWGRISTSGRTVPPVVVKPEKDSNRQSTKEGTAPDR